MRSNIRDASLSIKHSINHTQIEKKRKHIFQSPVPSPFPAEVQGQNRNSETRNSELKQRQTTRFPSSFQKIRWRERGREEVFKFVCLSGFVYELLRSKSFLSQSSSCCFPLFFNQCNWICQGKLQRLSKKKGRDSKNTEMGGMVWTDICMGRTESRVNDSCLVLERQAFNSIKHTQSHKPKAKGRDFCQSISGFSISYPVHGFQKAQAEINVQEASPLLHLLLLLLCFCSVQHHGFKKSMPR